MDKKRTIKDILKDMDNLYQKFIEKQQKIKEEKEALDFKLKVLERVYLDKKQDLEIEHTKMIEDEVRKEFDL